jgi:hypothetical protein
MSMVVEVGLSSSLPRADVTTRKEYVVQARLNNDVQPPTSTPDKAGSYLPTFSPHPSAPGPPSMPGPADPIDCEILGDFDH